MKKLDLFILNQSYESLTKNEFFANYSKGVKSEKLGDELYISNKKRGIEFIFDRNVKLINIHLFGRENSEYSSFKETIPFEIDLAYSKSMLITKYNLLKSGGGEVLPFLGKSNFWILIQIEVYNFRIEFKGDYICLISITPVKRNIPSKLS